MKLIHFTLQAIAFIPFVVFLLFVYWLEFSEKKKNKRMNTFLHNTRRGYLVKFVDPNKIYEVSYLAGHQTSDGKGKEGLAEVKGSDLTENQIVELFKNERL